MPRIRKTPEDFEVNEVLLHPLDGHGVHAYLQVEKRLSTTDEIAAALAWAAGVPRRDIGYAGRKDRFALTRQWFSVPAKASTRLEGWRHHNATIVAREFHSEELRIGQLKGNHFRLVVREVDEEDACRVQQQLNRLTERGFPNRFGCQRFGRNGRNVARGARILNRPLRKTNPRTARFLLSALQAAAFNRVFECRPAPFDELVTGDIAIIHDTGEARLIRRATDIRQLAGFDLSPTGPIFGTEMSWPQGEIAKVERRVIAEFGAEKPRLLASPHGRKLRGSRRALRAKPSSIHSEWDGGVFYLEFDLPAGTYATVLLKELFSDGFEDRQTR